MAKQKGVSLPSGQGGLIGGVTSSYKSSVEFSPKVVIVVAFVVVVGIGLLFNMY